MRTNKSRALASLGITGALALTIGLSAPARADYAPSQTDVVGIGGDTPQYDLDFVADGDAVGDAGYNAANNVNKLVSFDATADGNGRSAYIKSTTTLLNPTIVFRAGTSPIQRPQSTGDAYTLIANDTTHVVDFIRAGALPTTAQQNAVAGGLHVVQLGTDQLVIVTATTSNAPASLTVSDLVGIYTGAITKWNQIPGNSAGSADTIIPLLPPSTSVINKTLVNDLNAANGSPITLGASVQTVEQNDPSAITSLPAVQQPDALVSFSLGRLNLFNAGYFKNPNTKFPGGTALTSGVKVVPGYTSTLVHYVVFRQSDLAAAALQPWQPGSTRTWIQELFANPSNPTNKPFIATAAGQALLAAAGITPNYQDLGVVHQ
jgi:ABC-type phosphate transport system substrate-binding protein